ncbi:MAG: hypothetical protein ACOYJU_07560 [Anaerovoracaceae bacterium]|jgi:hypothetical protein
MKKLLYMVLVAILSVGLIACSGDSNGGDESDNGKDKESKEKIYEVGETWEVEGQWKFTITDVKEIQDRNDSEDWEPGAVYTVSYSLENVGYVDPSDESKGLYFNSAIIGAEVKDAKGKDGKAYAAGVSEYDKDPLKGETATGLDAFGVVNPGEFKLTINKLDGNGKTQEATFLCKAK